MEGIRCYSFWLNMLIASVVEWIKMNETIIYQYLDRIIGKPICSIGRVANMLWIGIGEKFITVNQRGKLIEKSTFALHIQTQWRIVNEMEGKVLLATDDMYSPRKDMIYQKDFDWEPQGNNLFDEKSQSWLKKEKNIFIKNYEINQWGDLILLFANNEKLQVFNLSSEDTECWRLFMPTREEPHLVVSGLQINLE